MKIEHIINRPAGFFPLQKPSRKGWRQDKVTETNTKTMKKFLVFICLLVLHPLYSQSQKVDVKVVGNNGSAISGAVVQTLSAPVEQKTTGADGMVSFDVAQGEFLRITHGGKSRVVAVSNSPMTIKLTRTDERVKTGFNDEIEKDRLTGAVDVVYSENLEKSPVANPAESLFGQLNGLTVLQNGGEPWNRSPDMFIRGKGTFNNNSMLVLVDGFERSLSSLSIAEIESVSVLKDAAATAIYGQKGANGVLLVTTKRGNYNSFGVDVSFSQGFNQPFRLPKFLDAPSYARAVNQAAVLDGNEPVYSDWDLEDFQSQANPYFFPNVNWMDETLRDYGTNTNFNSSFFGGGESVKYFVTLNYHNERGLFENTTLDDRYDSQLKYDLFNFRTNLDINLTSSTLFQVNVGGSIDGRKEPGARAGDIMGALFSVPSAAFPVETYNGVWGGTEYYNNNPVALVSSTGHRMPHGRQINADGRIIQDLSGWLEGLSAEFAVGYDNQVNYWENKTRDFLYESITVARDPASGAISDTTVIRYGSDTDLKASDSFGGQLRHTTIFGKVKYETRWNQSDLRALVMYHQDKKVRDEQYNTFLHQNLAASLSYGFKNRYFLDGVLSYSGSNFLPDGDRFGLFPALSAGWIVSRENFLRDNSYLNYLKLRASWGLTGNDLMSPNLYDQGFFGGGGYYFKDSNNGFGGIKEGQLPTIGLTYEESAKTNLGIDMEWFNQLQITLDAFYEKRNNILASANGSVPSLIGVGRPMQNIGEVENKGLEASLLWAKQWGDFAYHIGGNFSFVRNKIIEMNEEFQPYDYLKETGNPIDQQFGLEALGFFKDEADIAGSPRQLFSEVRPGDVKYKDQNNDEVIDQLDLVPLGYASNYPEIYYSSNLGFEYKGFGVDALFQGIANQTIYLNTKSVFWPLRGQNTISIFSNDHWTPQTANTASLPRLSQLENANNYRKNDIWLVPGDYLKLRRLEFYYNFPGGLLDRLNLKTTKIFVRGLNLFSMDKVDVMDPEEIGVTYPTLSSWHVGISLGF